MDEGSPNPNSKETFEQLELRLKKAEVELYESYVHGQKRRMDQQLSFEDGYQSERLRQARNYSNIAVILLIVDVLCVSAVVVFCCFIAIPYLHLPLDSVLKIVGAAATIIVSIFGIARWLYNKPNRFLEVTAGNLSSQDNETLSSKILRSRSKDKESLGKNTISTDATVLPDGASSIEADLLSSRYDNRQTNSSNLEPIASARPSCPNCHQSRYVRPSSTKKGNPVFVCTLCGRTFNG